MAGSQSPLVPMAMNQLFRGLMPPALKQTKTGHDSASGSMYPNSPKCDECGLVMNTQEQLTQHKAAVSGHSCMIYKI